MQLKQLLIHTSYESVQGSQRQEITDICYHSGKVRCGSLFVCLKGIQTDGHQYLAEAVEHEAAAVVVQSNWSDTAFSGVTVITVQDTRKALAELSAAFFDFPAKKLRMIGITGTKGKTTTAYLAAGMLREAGYLVGMIGTIAVFDGVKETPAERTTPEAYEIQQYLAKMVEHGCNCCVMEVSSQGLKMQRVAGIRYDVGVFLNIEPDHIGIGEHASFREYLSCKSRLMRQCDVGIINCDDAHKMQVLDGHTCKVEEFSIENSEADYSARNISFSMQEGRLLGRFTFCYGIEQIPFTMQLPGRFNVSNALAAVAIALHFSRDVQALQHGLAEACVKGRCENVSISPEYVLLIDYAHNEMSLQSLLKMLRTFEPSRLVVLFGCGGNRSKLRRDRMGEVAGTLADFSILTSDNPRWEDAEAIMDDIERGIRKTDGAYIKIANRKEAVLYAVQKARKGDIIVLAGKGHEGYQEIRGVKYPMLDHDLVADAFLQIEKE